MTIFSRLRSFSTAWTRRERFEDALDEEVRFRLEACTEELVRSGVPRREAVRRARVRFGSIERAKDDCRRARGLRLADEFEQMMANIRLALRVLLKNPVVTSVAIVSLALGIGANAAIFSLFSQILLRPLPVVEPERLVNLEAPGPRGGSSSSSCDGAGRCDEVFSHPMFRDLQREQTVFTDIAAHRGFGANVAYRGQTLSMQGMQVSASYFATLGLAPAVGRLFGPEVDEPIGGHPVVVLSHEFWQSDLGGMRDVLGEALIVNGQPLTVVGVAPAGFQGTTFNLPSSIFVPITMHGRFSPGAGEGRFENRESYWLYLFARLEPEVSPDQARSAMEPLYRGILAEVEAPLLVGTSDDTRARFVARTLPIEGHGAGERDGVRVERQWDELDDFRRQERADEAQRPLHHEQPGRAAEDGQETELGEQLRQQVPPRRADREPHRHLGRARGRAGEQQVRDVGARDQEDDGGDDEQQEQGGAGHLVQAALSPASVLISAATRSAGAWRAAGWTPRRIRRSSGSLRTPATTTPSTPSRRSSMSRIDRRKR